MTTRMQAEATAELLKMSDLELKFQVAIAVAQAGVNGSPAKKLTDTLADVCDEAKEGGDVIAALTTLLGTKVMNSFPAPLNARTCRALGEIMAEVCERKAAKEKQS